MKRILLVFLALLCFSSVVATGETQLILQNMTSDGQPPPYTAWSNGTVGSGAGQKAFAAFDGIFNGAGGNGDVQLNQENDHIGIDLGPSNATQVNAYNLSATTYAGSRNFDPANWTIEGSNDNTTWTPIDKQNTSTTWTAGQTRQYTTNATIAYRYYRMNGIRSENGGNTLLIAEWRLLRSAAAATSPISWSFNFTNSTSVNHNLTPTMLFLWFNVTNTTTCAVQNYTSNNANIPINLNNGIVNLSGPNVTKSANYTVTFSAADNCSNTITQVLLINVTNQFPTNSWTDKTFNHNTSQSYATSCTDIDNDALTYSGNLSSSIVTHYSNGSIYVSSGFSKIGTWYDNIGCSDTILNTSRLTSFTITNNAPINTWNAHNQTFNNGTSFTIGSYAYDPDGDSMVCSVNATMLSIDSNGTINYTSSSVVGSIYPQIACSDTLLNTSVLGNWTITIAPPPASGSANTTLIYYDNAEGGNPSLANWTGTVAYNTTQAYSPTHSIQGPGIGTITTLSTNTTLYTTSYPYRIDFQLFDTHSVEQTNYTISNGSNSFGIRLYTVGASLYYGIIMNSTNATYQTTVSRSGTGDEWIPINITLYNQTWAEVYINTQLAWNSTIETIDIPDRFVIKASSIFNIKPFIDDLTYYANWSGYKQVRQNLTNRVNGSALLNFCTNFSFSNTYTTKCTTDGTLVFTSIGNTAQLDTYNIEGGTYYNVSMNISNYHNTNVNVTNSTYQSLLVLRAYQLYSNTSITSFNGTNNLATNQTSTGILYLPANNGTNNIKIDVNGNYTTNVSCTVPTVLTEAACNVTGIYDDLFTIGANFAGVSITTFSANISNASLGGFLTSANTSTGNITFPVVQGYSYTFTLNPGSQASVANATLRANASTNLYNFSLLAYNTFELNFYNETTGDKLINQTITVEVISDIYSNNYTTNNGSLIISAVIPAAYTITYWLEPTVPRNYYVTFVNQSYNNISLYIIDSAISSFYLPVVNNEYTRPLSQATVILLRAYIIDNAWTYVPVEMAKTDTNGQAVLRIVPNYITYKLLISSGSASVTTAPTKFTANTNAYTLSFTQNALTSLIEMPSVSKSLTFNNATNTYVFTWTDTQNLVTQGCLNVNKYNSTGTYTVQNSCSSGSTGSIIYTVTDTNNTRYVASATLDTNTQYSTYSFGPLTVDFSNSATQVFGLVGLIFLSIVLVTVGFIALEAGTDVLGITTIIILLLFGVVGIVGFSWEAYIGIFIMIIIYIYKTNG